MRSAFVTAPYRVEIIDIPEPQVSDDSVLIRVRAAGICGSDLHLYKGTHAFRKPPAILGHEVTGDVVKIGKNVKGLKVGDRVTVEPHIPCGACEYCKSGKVNLCLNKIVPGTEKWTGTFVEYFCAPESKTYKIVDHISYETGVLIEPLAVANHALNMIKERQGKTLAILGSGTIGLLSLVSALQSGFLKIYCTDTIPFNLEFAKELGAYRTINVREEDCVEIINRETSGRGVDAVIVAAGAPGIIDQASQITCRTGTIVLVAMITEKIPVYTYNLVFKEQKLFGAMTYTTEDFKQAVDMVNDGMDISKLVTQALPMSQTQDGLEMLSNKTENVVKIIVYPDK
ncbi:MAG: zinc-dependent alcohol dehydrogenase [Bacillota bacterium]